MTYTRDDIARAIVDHAGLMAEHEDPERAMHDVHLEDIDGTLLTLGRYAAGPLQEQVKRAHENQDLPDMTLPAIIQVGLFHGLLIGLRLCQSGAGEG
jgi:hypothetical protein